MRGAIDSTSFPGRLLTVALLGCGALLLLIAARAPSPPPVYSMAEVRAGLIRAPGVWVGHTIRVRAVAGYSCVSWMGGVNPACISWRTILLDSYALSAEAMLPPALLDSYAPSAQTALPLLAAPRPPLLAALRRLPFARWLVGTPQQIRWGAFTTYRVLLRDAPIVVRGAAPCYEALLLDAAPGSL